RVLERDVEAIELAAIGRPGIRDLHVLGANERRLPWRTDGQAVDADRAIEEVVTDRLVADGGADRRPQPRKRVVHERVRGGRQVDRDQEDRDEDARPQQRATEAARPARPTRLGGPLTLAHASILAIIPACDSCPARCWDWPSWSGSACRIR